MLLAATTTSLFVAVTAILTVFALAALLLGDGTAVHKTLWTVAILAVPVLGVVAFLLFGKHEADEPLMR